MARSRGRGGSGGARESQRFAGYRKTELVLKIENDITSRRQEYYTYTRYLVPGNNDDKDDKGCLARIPNQGSHRSSAFIRECCSHLTVLSACRHRAHPMSVLTARPETLFKVSYQIQYKLGWSKHHETEISICPYDLPCKYNKKRTCGRQGSHDFIVDLGITHAPMNCLLYTSDAADE